MEYRYKQLKKSAAYLNVFAEYVVATVKGKKFHKPALMLHTCSSFLESKVCTITEFRGRDKAVKPWFN